MADETFAWINKNTRALNSSVIASEIFVVNLLFQIQLDVS